MERHERPDDNTRDNSELGGGRIEIVPLLPEHADIYPRLRESDLNEAYKLGVEVMSGLCGSIASSTFGYAMLEDGKAIAVCGVGPSNDPWMLASEEVNRHKMCFLRYSIRVFCEMRHKYKWLCNYVDADNEASIKWLRWLGFKMDEPEVLGKGNFRRFYWDRSDKDVQYRCCRDRSCWKHYTRRRPASSLQLTGSGDGGQCPCS